MVTSLLHTAQPARILKVACVHGDARSIPALQVRICGPIGECPLLVGVILDLPVLLLLAHHWDRILGCPQNRLPCSGKPEEEDAAL